MFLRVITALLMFLRVVIVSYYTVTTAIQHTLFLLCMASVGYNKCISSHANSVLMHLASCSCEFVDLQHYISRHFVLLIVINVTKKLRGLYHTIMLVIRFQTFSSDHSLLLRVLYNLNLQIFIVYTPCVHFSLQLYLY